MPTVNTAILRKGTEMTEARTQTMDELIRAGLVERLESQERLIETLTAALEGLLDCPAIADGGHNDPEWGCSETAEAESTARTALAQAKRIEQP